ncbi:glycosyltransferase family 2 protein [Halorubrum sp. SP9]|uniref:glycosyltransferase family 2 protein n=1 Tax=Halorubrum sp. SP9 TaxID=1537267 RepID=UPI0010F68E57|nr:glycosyltransferase family 2 protein [Halorubrum sp. SP9]TKX66103.1 glycosyltransferase family 2 protein [Halorubrum sp. SP9]
MSEKKTEAKAQTDDPFDGWELETPVAMMVYNRPEHTARVFDRIADAEPPVLLVVADGPVEGDGEDSERCRETRAVTEAVDWDCTVYRDYAETNMGIKDRFQSGLDWVFETVDEAIILEDDCLPNRSFFRFIEEMLDEYREDERVMDVSGSNHLETWKDDVQDYHFTRYGGIWGWGTWADRWELCRQDMEGWNDPEIRSIVEGYWGRNKQWDYVRELYYQAEEGLIETWDYQWGFTRAVNWGLTVAPCKNLVSNIGFGPDATNTKTDNSNLSQIPTHKMSFPVSTRASTGTDPDFDREYFFLISSTWDRYPVLQRVKRLYTTYIL